MREGLQDGAPACTHGNPALVKGLARAHRWAQMLEEGHYASISEMAAAVVKVMQRPSTTLAGEGHADLSQAVTR